MYDEDISKKSKKKEKGEEEMSHRRAYLKVER